MNHNPKHASIAHRLHLKAAAAVASALMVLLIANVATAIIDEAADSPSVPTQPAPSPVDEGDSMAEPATGDPDSPADDPAAPSSPGGPDESAPSEALDSEGAEDAPAQDDEEAAPDERDEPQDDPQPQGLCIKPLSTRDSACASYGSGLAKSAKNDWQVVSQGFAGNASTNKVPFDDVRIQKNVVPTDTENEFLVYLSIDVLPSLKELLDATGLALTTSNSYHSDPLGTIHHSIHGNASAELLPAGEKGSSRTATTSSSTSTKAKRRPAPCTPTSTGATARRRAARTPRRSSPASQEPSSSRQDRALTCNEARALTPASPSK
ncbi:MAG: hypothetical protein Q4D06_08160 [Coriobacteriia bacterium]|nr:hypothetical protein [Coriobacteriia bacterium]